jgi:TolB-like protein
MVGETVAHYRVLERLGSGGMGDVYRAEDLQLRRTVALKMLRRASGDDGSNRRLLAEARAASSLNHPNIAVVYESSEVQHDGASIGYIAMEYVEGETVAALAARGALDLDRVLDITDQIADALTEAHKQGLVHRDLKPSNVMLTPAGRVKVLDFGVAQHRAASHPAPVDVTRTAEMLDLAAGFVGTLPYVAPEQATGRQVDGRADIFSLGVMVYELANGIRPFAGANTAQILEAILRSDVPPFRDPDRDPRLPPLERLVRRMLARDPADRVAGAAELRTALAAVRGGGRLGDPGELTAHDQSLVVPAFANISGNSEDDWLGTGLSETLTADIGQLDGITVIPRERLSDALKALAAEGEERELRRFLRASHALGARWLLTGGFQRSGEAVRVTASVTDVGTGQIVSTAKVDGSLRAIFELQDSLVREVARTLRAAVAPDAGVVKDTEVVEAYEAFSRGLLNRSAETFESLDRAVWFFERAVALDPAYARAHAELGAALASKAEYLSLPGSRGRALASLRRAIELEPTSGNAWRELGSLLVAMGQEDEGMAALNRALAIQPENASGYGAMGRALFIGRARFREAMGWFTRALELNASAGWYALQLAHCAALLRDFAAGEAAARRAMELQEAFLSGREGLFITGGYIRAGHLAALQGRHAEALAFFDREIEFLDRTDHALRSRVLVELNARLGAAYLKLGDVSRADGVFAVALDSFERRVRLGADDPFTRYYAASVHAMRGDVEPALAFLERAVAEQRAFTAARARIEPEFDALRGDSRFERLVAVTVEHA